MLRHTLIGLMALTQMAAADPVPQGPKNVPEFQPEWPLQTRAPAMQSGVRLQVDVLAKGLDHPWGIAVLPGGGYLVTEREGRLRMIDDAGLGAPIAGVPPVDARKQGGLLDVALAENFVTSRVVFLTYAKALGDGKTATAAARAVLSADGTALKDVQEIFVQTPPSRTPMHYGSRVIPQGGYVYVTMGEHSARAERGQAQDIAKTYGKIVRLTAQGDPVRDNPFIYQGGAAALVWSTGHRNIQGAAIRPADSQLWALEHGPAGGDELNRIDKGANYGWPLISYGQNYDGSPVGSGQPRREGMVPPRYYWDPVIAPGGMVFYTGDMFRAWSGDVLAASLNPGGLVRLRLEGDKVTGEERFFAGELRIRDVDIDRDGAILILDDGNGRVLRITPQ